MRYYKKNRAPSELTDWINHEVDQNLTYSNCPSNVRRAVKEALLAEQGYLCAYSMMRIDSDSCHIEHFCPQSHYPERQLDYVNLLACYPKGQAEFGARYKADKTEPICCPQTKSDIADAFHYCLDGRIEGRTELARQTIDILNLNHQQLVYNRRQAILSLVQWPNLTASSARRMAAALGIPDSSGRLPEFFPALQEYLLRFAEKSEAKAQRLRKKPLS